MHNAGIPLVVLEHRRKEQWLQALFWSRVPNESKTKKSEYSSGNPTSASVQEKRCDSESLRVLEDDAQPIILQEEVSWTPQSISSPQGWHHYGGELTRRENRNCVKAEASRHVVINRTMIPKESVAII